RTDVVDANLGSIAVDPVCGDILAVTSYGPLHVAHDTLSSSALDVSLQLDFVEGGPGGVAAVSGNDVYAYNPPAGCSGFGFFSLVAVAGSSPAEAALSEDGKWAAVIDGTALDLLPRADNGAGLDALHLDFGSSDRPVSLAFAGNQLTAVHPQGSGF